MLPFAASWHWICFYLAKKKKVLSLLKPNYFDIKRRKINNLKKYFNINGDSPSYLYYAYCKGEIEGLPKVVIKWKPGPLGEKEFFKISVKYVI